MDRTSSQSDDVEHPVIPSAFGYAAQVVVLDPDSGEVHRVIAAHDVGRAVDSPYGMKRAGEIGPAGS